MLNHPASPWISLRSNRLLRTGFCFLLSLSCAIGGQLLFGSETLAKNVDTLHLNGDVFEWVAAFPAEKPPLTPLVICCILFLIGIVIFLLQPLYLKKSSQSRSGSRSKVISSNHEVSPVSPEIALPMYDRFVITPQSIIASTYRSTHSAPEIRRVPRTLPQLTQLVEDSLAEVMVLTGRDLTLDASAVVLGIQRLHENNLDVVVTPQSGFSSDRIDNSESLQSALHKFLCDSLEIHPIDELDTSDGTGQRICYIVSRNALLSMLSLSQWTVDDRSDAMVSAC